MARTWTSELCQDTCYCSQPSSSARQPFHWCGRYRVCSLLMSTHYPVAPCRSRGFHWPCSAIWIVEPVTSSSLTSVVGRPCACRDCRHVRAIMDKKGKIEDRTTLKNCLDCLLSAHHDEQRNHASDVQWSAGSLKGIGTV